MANCLAEERVGRQAEANFPQACSHLGIAVLPRDRVGSNPGVPYAVARATEAEDLHEGTDFWLWVGDQICRWVRLDLTVASDPWVLERKRASARQNGVVVVWLPARALELAARGAHRDLKKVRTGLQRALEAYFRREVYA